MQKGLKNIIIPLVLGLLSSFTMGLQVCRTESEIPATTPTSQFTVHNDGTVTDTATRLMWMRCSLGQTWNNETCEDDAKEYNWQGALEVAANNHNFSTYDDWRLPNIKELVSIIEESCTIPAINLTIFPNTSGESNYWSSTHWAREAAFFISLYVGEYRSFEFTDVGQLDHNTRPNAYKVRLVRGGE